MCLTLSEVQLIQLIPPESASNAKDIPDISPACGCVMAGFLLTHSRLKQINLNFTLTLLQHKGLMSANFLSLTKMLASPPEPQCASQEQNQDDTSFGQTHFNVEPFPVYFK